MLDRKPPAGNGQEPHTNDPAHHSRPQGGAA